MSATPPRPPSEDRPARRKGRLVLKPSDLDERELDVLRRELADLRAAHNDLVFQLNRQSRWVEQFVKSMRVTLDYAPWRWCAWILPLPIPSYEDREELPYLTRKDAKPSHDKGAAS